MQDGNVKLLQGVREIFEFVDTKKDEGMREGKIVLIGRNVQKAALQQSLDEALRG